MERSIQALWLPVGAHPLRCEAKMKRLMLCAAVLAGLSAVGCRAAGNQDLLERELRFQEDRINHLQGHVADYRQQLDCAQAENDALRAEVAQLKGGAPATGELPAVRPAPYRTPQILPPGSQVPEGQPLGPPSGRLPPVDRTPAGVPFDFPMGPPKVELPSGSSSDGRPVPAEMQAAGAVAALTFNQQLTGGYDNDQRPGDDGVMVLVEPRSAQGEIVELHGPLSIVLLDPALQGDAARIARWDLAEDEAAAHFRRSPQGAGIQLELPWPTGAPAHRQLKLFARSTLADGRKFDASKDIEVISPGEHVRRWTRSARQARVQTVPIAEPGRPARDLDERPAAPPPEDRDPPAAATARGPQWTPYR
jgi:hypothetical protein